jgi:hypothetical protein
MDCARVHFLRCLITADKLERAEIIKVAHALRQQLMNLRLASVPCVPLPAVFRLPPNFSRELYLSNRCVAWTHTALSLEPVHWNKSCPAEFS